MPIPIKYAFSATSYDNAVRLGNIALGVNAVDYGPSTTTGWTNAVPALNGGYAIYYFSGTNIRMRTAVDDATLITVAGQIMGTTYTSVSGSLIGLTGGGFTPVSVNPPNTVTSGSVLNLNAGLVMSYPKGGNTWYDINGTNTTSNGTLTNGPTFDSTSNSIVFDGTNDYVQTSYNTQLNDFTICALFRNNSSTGYARIADKNYQTGFWFGQNGVSANQWGGGVRQNSGFNFITLSNSAWHFIAMTRTGTTLTVYGDGITNTNTTTCGAGALDTTILSLGATINTGVGQIDWFTGNISNVQIYNRVLPPSEILQNYYQGNIVTSSLTMALDAGNLVSYPGSGTAWTTLTGSNSGTLTNGPTFSSANGGAIVFDGTNDYVTIPSTSNLSPGTGDFTYSSWINPSSFSSTYSGLLVVEVVGGLWIGKLGSNFVLRAYAVADYIQYATLPSLNVWTNIVITRSGTTATLYYNAVSVASTTTSQNFGQGTAYIGNDGSTPSANFNGKIATTMFYKGKALSQTEIQQNFNAHKNRFNL